MHKFGFPRKLIRLANLCMENTQYTVRVDNTMSTPFTVYTGLKQGDALFAMLFNLVLEKVVRELQCLRGSQVTKQVKQVNNDNELCILGFANDLDIIVNSLTEIANASRELIWQKICGPVFDANVGCWRRRFNTELQEIMNLAPVTNFIKGQRIQWLGHILRREENGSVRVAFERKPKGKRPRGRPRKR
ncbi:Reverse transcriptase domain-containing protein [Aphis craccivora]|uniref:Reverse transcriptase domain-containing protein n=1 Tax=Aphis craccivora TaxID=307492 RepID=A0A6G0XLI3_APHCR|nr:Reverse transcriptase domain-containing protein [Aphis craccivora]